MNYQNTEESEFRKRLREKEEFIDRSYQRSISALTGAMIGQGLDGPIKALSNDLRTRKEQPLIEESENVVSFSNPNKREEKKRQKRIKKNKLKAYKPTFGVPKSKASILGGVVGGMVGPTVIDDIKAIKQERENKKESNQLINDLEKEASINYRTLPILDKKY